jgi:hypothetical protein
MTSPNNYLIADFPFFGHSRQWIGVRLTSVSLLLASAPFTAPAAAQSTTASHAAPALATAGPAAKQGETQHPYAGMWVTDDGYIRHELLRNGRYDEARGSRESAYRGRYEVKGKHIDYWDDTGFTADGEFVDQNTLHHGGMLFRRR